MSAGPIAGRDYDDVWGEGTQLGFLPKRPTLGITEVATMLAALNLLFLLFVSVQGRYLFGGDALVQVTPGLTYAEYARRGFFELVVATALVVHLQAHLRRIGFFSSRLQWSSAPGAVTGKWRPP